MRVFALAAALWASSGCGVDAASDPVGIRFVELNGASVQGLSALNWEDDRDAQKAGIQVSVLLQVGDLAPGSTVRLSVGGQQLQANSSAAGDVKFEGVTLQPGVNLLEADCDVCHKEQLTAEVFAPRLDLSDLVVETVTAYTHDTDVDAEGIQHEFLIRAPQVPDGVAIDVQVGAEAYTVSVHDGQAFLALTIAGYSAELLVQAEALVGDGLVSDTGTMRVQGASCEVISVGEVDVAELLDDEEALWMGVFQDQSTAPGFQVAVVVWVGGLPGTRVVLMAGSDVIGDVEQDEFGLAVIEGVMPEGDFSLGTRCLVEGAPDVHGRTFDAHVDTTPPAAVGDLGCTMIGSQYLCQWTSPQDPGRTESVGQWELRYLVDGTLCQESYPNATPVPSLPPPGESGAIAQVMFQLLDPPSGAISLALMSWDRAGNPSPVSNIVTMPAE